MDIPRCAVSRYTTAWAESHEGAVSAHLSWALLCRFRCRLLLAEIRKGSNRNAELKQRLLLWEAGEVHDLVGRILGQQRSGPPSRRKNWPAADQRTARKKSLCPCGTGFISKAMKRTRGWSSSGFSRMPEELDYSLGSIDLWQRKTSLWHGVRSSGTCSLEWRQIQDSSWRTEKTRAQQNGNCVAPTCQIGPTGERQEHLAGAGQRRRLFRVLDIFTVERATGDLPEECRFLLNTQLIFLKRGGVLKFIHVVNNHTIMHVVHSCTVCFSTQSWSSAVSVLILTDCARFVNLSRNKIHGI